MMNSGIVNLAIVRHQRKGFPQRDRNRLTTIDDYLLFSRSPTRQAQVALPLFLPADVAAVKSRYCNIE